MYSNIDIDKLVRERFAHSTPRSEQYKNGWKSAMKLKLRNIKAANPHIVGTCNADAWWAGFDAGMNDAKLLITKIEEDQS